MTTDEKPVFRSGPEDLTTEVRAILDAHKAVTVIIEDANFDGETTLIRLRDGVASDQLTIHGRKDDEVKALVVSMIERLQKKKKTLSL